jgi:arabinose-5-phosphate isomerase
LMAIHDFKSQDFARYHPGGQLGRNLWLHVADVMHGLDKIAWAQPSATLKEVVIAMTQFPLGAACILDEEKNLLGIITDGDVRRALRKHDDIRLLTAEQVMVSTPTTITPDATLTLAVDRMEKRVSQISVLPVVDLNGTCLGLIRIHDIYQANI